MKQNPPIHWPARLTLHAGAIVLITSSGAFAAEISGAAGGEPDMWLRLAARLHPMVVHFPIALLLTALLVETFSRLRRKPGPSPTALTCLALGVISAACAIASGLANEEYESHGKALAAAIDQHQLWGIITGSVGAAALVLGLLSHAWNRKALRWTYFIALLGAGALTAATGHMGGSLVYGEDYLTSVIWPSEISQTTPAPATNTPPTTEDAGNAADQSTTDAGVYYEPDIRAIIAARCENCHGPSKQRGGLRLDHYAGLFGDDETLWVVQPFEPERSEMLRRVSLPDGDDDAMPPKGDRLSAEQIGLIKQWIEQGAPDAPTNASADDHPGETRSKPEAPLPSGDTTFVIPPAKEVNWASIKASDPLKAAEAISNLSNRGAAARQILRSSEAIDINFSVMGKSISDDDLALLDGLEDTLVWLNLAGTSITTRSAQSLTRFPQLRRLHLERTAIGDDSLSAIAALPHLEYLNLYGTAITDAGLHALESLTTLRELYLWRTAVTADGVARFKSARPDVAVASPWSEPPGVEPEQETTPNDP